MKRFHVHVAVSDVERSIRFYAALFAAEPTVVKLDYAKWMLEDPRVNFAISRRGDPNADRQTGVQHLGIQVEDEGELAEVYGRLKKAERPVLEQASVHCCYATSDKHWIADPEGIAWEAFLTHGEHTVYGEDGSIEALKGIAKAAAPVCCEPVPAKPQAARCGCSSRG